MYTSHRQLTSDGFLQWLDWHLGSPAVQLRFVAGPWGGLGALSDYNAARCGNELCHLFDGVFKVVNPPKMGHFADSWNDMMQFLEFGTCGATLW